MARITVFDTTLRDGEQSPGSSMTAPEKLRLAHELAELGVDVLEAGFAASSPEDAESIERIATYGAQLRARVHPWLEALEAWQTLGGRPPDRVRALARELRHVIDAAVRGEESA